jgi:hypothetical protein
LALSFAEETEVEVVTVKAEEASALSGSLTVCAADDVGGVEEITVDEATKTHSALRTARGADTRNEVGEETVVVVLVPGDRVDADTEDAGAFSSPVAAEEETTRNRDASLALDVRLDCSGGVCGDGGLSGGSSSDGDLAVGSSLEDSGSVADGQQARGLQGGLLYMDKLNSSRWYQRNLQQPP